MLQQMAYESALSQAMQAQLQYELEQAREAEQAARLKEEKRIASVQRRRAEIDAKRAAQRSGANSK
jgi:hypothetical protein